MFAPNTYLIGAQKCGTTFLASLLDQNPDVCVCSPKEPQFFSLHYETGRESYARSFARPEARVTIDASTTYTFLRPRAALDLADAPGLTAPVPARIKAACPEARFIYVMRDPVARAISSWRHIARYRAEKKTGALSLLAEFDEEPLLELAGRYADQIERYFDVFPRDRFLFLKFEDLIADPERAVRACCDFLDLVPLPVEVGQDTDTHGAHDLSAMGRLIRRKTGLKRLLRQVVPKAVRGPLAGMLLRREAPEVTFVDREAAAARFAEDRARVRELTGIEI